MAICRTHMVFGKFKNIQTDCTVVQPAQNIRTREEQMSSYSMESASGREVGPLDLGSPPGGDALVRR